MTLRELNVCCCFSFVAVLMSLPPILRAENNQVYYPQEVVKQSIYLSKATVVETSAYIHRTTVKLTIQMQKIHGFNEVASVVVAEGSDYLPMPVELFETLHAWATTNLYGIAPNNVGFVLFSGSGEHAKHYVFQINFLMRTVQRNDWDQFGNLEAIGKIISLRTPPNSGSR